MFRLQRHAVDSVCVFCHTCLCSLLRFVSVSSYEMDCNLCRRPLVGVRFVEATAKNTQSLYRSPPQHSLRHEAISKQANTPTAILTGASVASIGPWYCSSRVYAHQHKIKMENVKGRGKKAGFGLLAGEVSPSSQQPEHQLQKKSYEMRNITKV